MKKLIALFFFIFISMSVSAQVYNYRASKFAYKYINSYGNWTKWSDWEYSNVKISIDFYNDVIQIYSKERQYYSVIEYIKTYKDNEGGTQSEFKVIDQDYDYGIIRLRIESNGNSQLYVDFANMMFVYSGLRRL